MSISEKIQTAREQAMAPHLPWFRGEPVLRIPLDCIKIDRERQNAYVAYADLAKAFAAKS